MKKLTFRKIDAFATGASSGNPAAAVHLEAEAELSADEMQRVARELKGFVSEVGFCGHVTIATMVDLIQGDPELRQRPTLTVETSKGRLAVENRADDEDAVYITAPAPRFSPHQIDRAGLASALGIPLDALVDGRPAEIVNAGLETLVVPIDSLETMLAVRPEFDTLETYCRGCAVDIITLFSEEVADAANAYRVRVFAPTFGTLEDPATGSGNAALGHYLLRRGAWDGSPMTVEQNGERTRPTIVKLSATIESDGSPQVRLGGGAVLRFAGQYYLT